MSHQMGGRFGPARLIFFLFGLALIFFPSFIVYQTLRDVDEAKRETISLEAGEKNESMLKRFKKLAPAKPLIEERLQLFAEDVASIACSFNPDPNLEELWRGTLESLPKLKKRDLYPLALAIIDEKFLGETSSSSMPFELSGKTLETGASFSRLVIEQELHHLVLFHIVPGKIRPRFPDLQRNLAKVLNTEQTPSGFYKFRGRCIEVQYDGKPGLLFWQLLKPPGMDDLIAREFPETRGFPPESSSYDYPIKQKFFIGGILVIVPLRNEEEKAKTITDLVDDSETLLAYLPRGGAPKMSPGFAQALGKNFFESGRNPPGDWLVASGEAIFDRTVEVFAATRLADTSLPFQGILARLGLGCLVLALAFLWGYAVFFEVGIAASLFRQLGWGFMLAAFLPTVAIFSISEQLAKEHLESLSKEARHDLRRAMDQKQRGFIVNRPREWRTIQTYFQESPLKGVLNPAFESFLGEKEWASSPSVLQVKQVMEKAFEDYEERILPLGMNFLIVAGLRGFFLERNSTGMSEAGIAGPGFAGLMEEILLALNPALVEKFPDRVGEIKTGTKKEILVENIQKLLLSCLGADKYFDFMFGQNQPMIISLGIGFSSLMQIFLPNPEVPEFVIFLFYPMRSPDAKNISKALSGQTGEFRVYAIERERIGGNLFPESGDSIPFVRQAARQARQMNAAMSLTFPWEGETFLVEVNPNYPYHQFIVIGATSQKPLVRKVERLKIEQEALMLFALMVTMLLAFSGAREILQPISHLVEGMKEVRKGNFTRNISGARSDELGALIQAYNRMIKGLAEGNLLGKMVSSQARAAVDHEAGKTLDSPASRRDAIILYFGCPGIERIQKEIPPEEFIERLDRQTRLVCRMVLAVGGDIDKFMGEKILAVVFPEGNTDQQRAGSEILELLRNIRRAEKAGELPFVLAVGINYGEVITGFLGSLKRRDHTIIGDSVNLAARCEAIAEELDQNRVVITDSFLSLIPWSAPTRLEVSQVKGKQQKVVLYQLEA